LHQVLVFTGLLHYGSRMSTNFYAAIFSFVVTMVATLLAGRLVTAKPNNGADAHPSQRVPVTGSALTLGWALAVLVACVAVNVWLR
jgi:hypothetical protein